MVVGVRKVNARWCVEVSKAAAALLRLQVVVNTIMIMCTWRINSMTVISAIDNNMEGSYPLHLLYDSIILLSSRLFVVMYDK